MYPSKTISLILVLAAAAAPSAALAQAKPAAGAVAPGVVAPSPTLNTPPVTPVGPAKGDASKPADSTKDEYIIGPEDVVEVEVVGQPDHSRARVYTDGTIQVNLAGRLAAAGKTPRELGNEVAAALKAGGYYANPAVNVEVVGFSSRYVTVLGAVGSPGLVPINRPYRLSEVLARVGGVREGAADYIIVRSEAGPEKRYNVDTLSSGTSSEDPMVVAGDKIFAPSAELIYITGQVKSPGTYPIKTNMTIAQAIARSGGLTDSGTDKHVKVTRGGKTVKLEISDKVEAGDVLLINEKLF
ncbi:SLBB domain-containing protein [Phenylobacterium sp.]|uniref:SLBB domain-containing protein n=1 Tax=Phenylobacterium sp. TaxID=1871053 RepID=UPI00374CA935